MTNSETNPRTSTLSTVALNVQAASGSYSPNEEEQAAIATLPKGSALLIGTNAELRGARFLLNVETTEEGAVKSVIAGRSPSSDIFLNDVTVSRQHAVFMPNAGTFVLTDNNSLNGTYVNGDRVDQAFLKNGADVRIGKFHFSFFLGTGK